MTTLKKQNQKTTPSKPEVANPLSVLWRNAYKGKDSLPAIVMLKASSFRPFFVAMDRLYSYFLTS